MSDNRRTRPYQGNGGDGLAGILAWPHWFALFKWSVYLVLTLNIGFFFQEERQASMQLTYGAIDLLLLLELYAATIDTTAWVVLLLVFELETFQLEDQQITPGVSRLLIAIRLICFGFIVTAMIGYVLKTIAFYGAEPLAAAEICSLVAAGYTKMVDQDVFLTLSLADCRGLLAEASAPLMVQHELQWFALAPDFSAVAGLMWIDIANAGVWILIVLLIELDVQFTGARLGYETWMTLSRILKVIAYSALVVFAIYWGFAGTFLDFEDAFLWIMAFVFIERNVVIWEKELNKTAAEGEIQ